MAQRLSLVALVVPSYEAGLSFYVDTLGFSCERDEVMGGGKRWVVVAPPGGAQTSGTALLLARAVDARQHAAIGNQAGGRVGFFLETDDFARDHEALRARGVTFEEEPRHEPYGTVAVFSDPFGNRWDLIEPSP